MSESPFAWMGLFQTEYLRNVDINTNLLCHKFKHGGITFEEEERDESAATDVLRLSPRDG